MERTQIITRDAVAHIPPSELSIKSRPNWTAVWFLLTLSTLHFCIAVPAFMHQRWEGYLSAILATTFFAAAVVAHSIVYEVCILPTARSIRIRTGTRRFHLQRHVPFHDVHAVRLTLMGTRKSNESRIELLCDNEDIECPATQVPRQQALFLAVMMGVQLIKVSSDNGAEPSDRSL